MTMDNLELTKLKAVLPEGFTVEVRDGLRPRLHILDEDGEVFVQCVGQTARVVIVELMEQARRNGVHEGREGALHGVRTALGLDQKLRELWGEVNELKQR
jgi:hypothetical protein